MNTSEQVKDIFTAVANLQSKLVGVIKDSENPFFKSHYADLDSCWEVLRKPLADCGLCVIQTMDHDNGNDFLITTLGHVSGQWMRSKYRLTPVKNDPQAMGSATTYARRYCLAAITGLTQRDDDAQSAMPAPIQRANPFPPETKAIAARPPQVTPIGTLPAQDDSIYRVPFGKTYKGMTLDDMGQEAVSSFMVFLEKSTETSGKPLNKQASEFIDEASAWFNNQPPMDDVRY